MDRQVETLRTKIDRLEAMILDARARRDHLFGHLEEVESGREPTPHEHGKARR